MSNTTRLIIVIGFALIGSVSVSDRRRSGYFGDPFARSARASGGSAAACSSDARPICVIKTDSIDDGVGPQPSSATWLDGCVAGIALPSGRLPASNSYPQASNVNSAKASPQAPISCLAHVRG